MATKAKSETKAKGETKAKPATKGPQTKAADLPAAGAKLSEAEIAAARERLAATGRNDACPCGSGKKYKKCHLPADEQGTFAPPAPPDAKELAQNGWRLFEQRRPGAAEKEFRAALAIDAELLDARVGIGMSRLQANNADGAKEELRAVLTASENVAKALEEKKSKDAFGDPAAQPYLRAAHALGCLAYDEEKYEDAVKDLARVHAIDDGALGVEARLIASKALLKLERPKDAVAVLEPATKLAEAQSRAEMNLGLARFAAGDEAGARKAMAAALEANPHFGKVVLGRVRRHVENVAAAGPGTLEQALLYAQTYADVWTDGAKDLLEKVMDERAQARSKRAAEPGQADEAEDASPSA
jgi:Tfp pilus assembly protein PilF